MLTQSVAALMSAGVGDLQRVAQDGMRVRASAGAASFRRGPTLLECLEDAEDRWRRCAGTGGGSGREEPQAEGGAGACARRTGSSGWRRRWRQLPEVEAKKDAKSKDKARVSTTDPDARVMKMGDGGFRPAFNLQFATDTASR